MRIKHKTPLMELLTTKITLKGLHVIYLIFTQMSIEMSKINE